MRAETSALNTELLALEVSVEELKAYSEIWSQRYEALVILIDSLQTRLHKLELRSESALKQGDS